MDILSFLLVGLVAGWLGGILARGGGFGLIGNLVVGVVGALIGGWLLGRLGFSFGGGFGGSLLTATLGAVVLLILLRLIGKSR